LSIADNRAVQKDRLIVPTCDSRSLITGDYTIGNKDIRSKQQYTDSGVRAYYAVHDTRTAAVAIDHSSMIMIAPCHREPIQRGAGVLPTLEVEPLMRLVSRSLAIDDAGPGTLFTSDCDSFAFEVDIAVAIASICAWGNDDHITIESGINRGLDCVEICRPIVVDGDYSCLTGNGQEQADRGKNQLFHLGSLLKTGFIDSLHYTILSAYVKAKCWTITVWQFWGWSFQPKSIANNLPLMLY